jgi:hypothetical protein
MNGAQKAAPESLQPEQLFPSEEDIQHAGRIEALSSITARVDQQVNIATCKPLEMVLWTSLRPHPALIDLDLMPLPEQILEKEKVGRFLFELPLLITNDNVIVDGHKRYLVASRQGFESLQCRRCDLTEDQALFPESSLIFTTGTITRSATLGCWRHVAKGQSWKFCAPCSRRSRYRAPNG